jgi:hypothetical protein
VTSSQSYYDPAKYKAGTLIRVKPRAQLEAYLRPQWKYHHPLQTEQLDYAGRTAPVAKTFMYHGGNMLYELSGIPGIWHEACLDAADSLPAV